MFSESRTLAFYVMVLGNTLGVENNFIDRLRRRLNLCQVHSEEACDVIMAFVSIVSRAGTDIEAALNKISTDKPVLLVVLHHTFEENYMAPESRWIVKREGVLAMDVFFHEDLGLLRCLQNDKALKSTTDHLISLGASLNVQLKPTVPGRKECKWNIVTLVILTVFSLLAIIAIILLIAYFEKWL